MLIHFAFSLLCQVYLFSVFVYYTTKKKCGKLQKFLLGNIAKILTLCHGCNVNQC